MELSKLLRDYSRTIAGKEQLLIGAIAKALEIIPRQLCDNAGFDATNILNKLRQKHAQGNPVNSVLSNSSIFWVIMLHNSQQDGKIQFNCGGSLQSHVV
jgi:chaperonin GroEL (HSP60 family)